MTDSVQIFKISAHRNNTPIMIGAKQGSKFGFSFGDMIVQGRTDALEVFETVKDIAPSRAYIQLSLFKFDGIDSGHWELLDCRKIIR